MGRSGSDKVDAKSELRAAGAPSAFLFPETAPRERPVRMSRTQSQEADQQAVIPFRPYLAFSASEPGTIRCSTASNSPSDFFDAMRAVEREFYDR